MLSRVAENLYWISRYVERAENVARLLDVGFHLELDAARHAVAPVAGSDQDPRPIESVMTILACRPAYEQERGEAPPDRESVLRFLTFDQAHSHSIIAMIGRARENARGSQEALSGEAWSQLNKLHLHLHSPRAERHFNASPPRFYESIKHACILFSGLVETTLPRTEAYHFLQLGRYLERANQIARLLSVRLPVLGGDQPPDDLPLWSSLLQTCSATEAYLREFNERIEPEGVVRYLVLDPDFPRSIRFCVSRCCESLRAIAGNTETSDLLSEAERRLGRLDSELRFLDVSEIFGQGLANFLYNVQKACTAIGSDIHHAYFFF
jgi:uncharacterized alpha-E superfamily protein